MAVLYQNYKAVFYLSALSGLSLVAIAMFSGPFAVEHKQRSFSTAWKPSKAVDFSALLVCYIRTVYN